MERKLICLFRSSPENWEEQVVAEKFMPVYISRVLCQDAVVVGRYSVLPFYDELYRDLAHRNCRLINSFSEHLYVADFHYYEDLKEHTFMTWFRLQDVPKDSGPWVVKGRTNSRKLQWSELMYCDSWQQLVNVYRMLQNDPLIGPQDVIVRKFEPLQVVQESVAGPPFSNEWRFFYYKGQYLSHGFYWSQADLCGQDEGAREFADKIALIIQDRVPFVVIDVALNQEGRWRVVELNDGQMSGLSHNQPEILYENLSRVVRAELEKKGMRMTPTFTADFKPWFDSIEFPQGFSKVGRIVQALPLRDVVFLYREGVLYHYQGQFMGWQIYAGVAMPESECEDFIQKWKEGARYAPENLIPEGSFNDWYDQCYASERVVTT